jgi:hypothetical protein
LADTLAGVANVVNWALGHGRETQGDFWKKFRENMRKYFPTQQPFVPL